MVTIIITTYNYAKYLERAIRSCLNQSLDSKLYEILVINDASTDYTKEVLENYEDEVRIYNFEENRGLAAARNFGIKKAKGQYVVFLDADDYIQKDLLLLQKTFLEENNNLDAVSMDYYTVDERGKHLEHISAATKPIACGIMFRKDLMYEIGLYDEAFKAREEEDFHLRFLEKYDIYNICLPLYRYRQHGYNMTLDKDKMAVYQRMLRAKHSVKTEE